MPTRRKWAWIASGQAASVVFGLCNEALGVVSLRLSQRQGAKPSCCRSGSILTFAAGGIACGSPADDSGTLRMDHAALTVPTSAELRFFGLQRRQARRGRATLPADFGVRRQPLRRAASSGDRSIGPGQE